MFERQKKKNFMESTRRKSMHHNEQQQDDDVEDGETQKRYYIYSHTKHVNGTIDAADEDDKGDEKISRKIRSSTKDRTHRSENKTAEHHRKQISKNISMVLENLMAHYENSQLPTHGQGWSGCKIFIFIFSCCDSMTSFVHFSCISSIFFLNTQR